MINFIVRAVALTLVCLAAHPAFAQGWPSKPVRYVVPFPPAGATDILARITAERISPALGQQVVVENRPGAAGNLGTDLVAKSTPGRLHHPDADGCAVHQRDAVHQAAVFPAARSCPGSADRARAQCHGGASFSAGEDGEGIHCARQGASRPDQLRLLRQRHLDPHVG